VGVTGLTAVGLSLMTSSFMMKHTESLVQVALIFSVISTGVMGVFGFLVGNVLLEAPTYRETTPMKQKNSAKTRYSFSRLGSY